MKRGVKNAVHIRPGIVNNTDHVRHHNAAREHTTWKSHDSHEMARACDHMTETFATKAHAQLHADYIVMY